MSWSLSTSSYRPDNLSGKTTFLLYYLVQQLKRAEPTVYFSKGKFYIFTEKGVHSIGKEPDFGEGWLNTTCLVDTDITKPPPLGLMVHSLLFVLAASSPRPSHRRWVARRRYSQQFVINPPSQYELFQVLVRSFIPHSLCSHFSVSLLRTCAIPPCLKFGTLS